MPFVAWETGVSLTTSVGLRVMAEAACDMLPYSTHSRESIWPEGAYNQGTPLANAHFLTANAVWGSYGFPMPFSALPSLQQT
jgi:hypothetical protein